MPEGSVEVCQGDIIGVGREFRQKKQQTQKSKGKREVDPLKEPRRKVVWLRHIIQGRKRRERSLEKQAGTRS